MGLNLAECLDDSAESCPDREALVFDDLRMSYGEVAAAAKRVANVLRDKGIGRGDTVGVMLPNTPHFPIVYYGILYSGATVAPANPLMRYREIAHWLRDSGAKVLFVFADCAEESLRAFEEIDSCAHLVLVEKGFRPSEPEVGESFVSLMASASPEFDMVQTQPEDLAAVIYTSAIMEHPAGAELTHSNLYHNALAAKQFALKYYPEDICLTVLPLFHGFGQTAMLNTPFMAQSKVVLAARFETHKIFELIEREKVTLLAMVPAMFHLMWSYKRSADSDLSSVRAATSGGAAMPVELSKQFMERFNVPVLEGYGLTETSPVVTYNEVATNRLGSIGKPIWGCRVAIMRADGSFADTGEEGEIVIRGHHVMRGYRNHPEAMKALTENGWFHTRDLGRADEDGFLYITGLLKDLVITSGMNVSPPEVEKVLREHPAVWDAAVVGVPDSLRGENVEAFVVLAEGASVRSKELSAFCRDQMSSYKCPRRFTVLEALPRKEDGNVDKATLRATRAAKGT